MLPAHFTIVDIKVIDPAAASYVNMTSKSPLHRHRALEVAGPRDYFGPSRRPSPGARMRVVTFVVSTFGSLGAQAQALIKDIAKRTNFFVPPSLSHETSRTTCTSSISTFLRSAITFQVRKRVAARAILRDHLPDDFLPPPSVQSNTTRAARAAQGCTDNRVRVDTGSELERRSGEERRYRNN